MSWPMVKLGDLVRAHYGKALKKEDRKNNGQFEVFGSSGIIGFHDDYLVDYPTLIVGRKGSVGHIVWAPDGGWVIDTAYFLQIKEPDRLDLRYLFYALRSANLASKTITTSIPGLNRDDLYDSEIPLPPLAEQKRIAAILDKADAIRRKRQQAIQLADDFLRGVFLEMFGDPVTNPKGWELRKLVDLCDVGSSKRVFVEEFVESGIPFYRGTEVGKLGNGEEIDPSLFISEKHYQKLKEHGGVPQIGDLLLPSICPDGRIWQVSDEKPFYFKDGRVLWIKSSNASVSPDYLRSYLQHIFFANYNAIASGTTFAELKIVALKNLDILIPPKNVQEQYSFLMKKTFVNISNQLAGLNEQSQLFDCISQKAFSGQL